jgi:hypothetical protein
MSMIDGPASSTLSCGSSVGSGLLALLMAPDIQPGDSPSYQLCKIIYTNHAIGKKMVDAPITKAQSQRREISVPDGPEDACIEAFEKVWDNIGSDKIIAQAFSLARVYGLSTLVAMPKGAGPREPIDYPNLWKDAAELRFNVLDPLNTSSGSQAMNQDPNSPDFLKIMTVSVAGVPYNVSRAVITQNEDPIYIDYTSSSFGYTGRSVYQRALLPLKSFIQSMITDDLVTIKAGILVAKIKSPGSIVDNIMLGFNTVKRQLIKIAKVGSVISVGSDDAIESLDLTNIEGAMSGARKNILENIAVSADMPAILLNNETFAEGFGEGTEDSKQVVEYIDGIRIKMKPLYDFMDRIVKYLAWNPEFYKTIQERFPDEYGSVKYEEAFYAWSNSFAAKWPSLMREPESELIKVDAVKLESMIAQVQVLLPVLDPDNKAALVEYLVDNFNSLKRLFPNPLVIDGEALLAFLVSQKDRQETNEDKQLEAKSESGPSPDRKFGDSAGQPQFPGLKAVAFLPASASEVRGKGRSGKPLAQ